MKTEKLLTEKQLQAVELLANGIPKTEVAKVVGVDRSTVHLWMKNDKFKREVNEQIKENKENIDKMMMTYTDSVISKLYELAMGAKSEKVRLDACTYILNRVAGTPIAKTEITEIKEEEKKYDPTWEDLENLNKKKANTKSVIPLKASNK